MANKNRWGSVSGLAVMGAIAMLTGAAVRRLLRHQQQNADGYGRALNDRCNQKSDKNRQEPVVQSGKCIDDQR